MAYSEKNFQTEFKNQNEQHGVFELKITKGKSVAFSQVADHQKEALQRANKKGCYWKIADVGFAQKPFDCFFLKKTPAYIVVMFYEKRKKKNVYYIEIKRWLKTEKTHKRKSLKEHEVKEIAKYNFNFLKK